MIAVALKGLAGRKVRAVLTSFAIVIGVAMMSGTFILTDTMERSFDGLFQKSSAQTDAVVSARTLVKNATHGSGVTVPESLLTEIRALPQVATAAADVAPQESNVADILGRNGRKVAKESIGRGFDPATSKISPTTIGPYSPLELVSGEWAEGPREVVIDARTAAKQRYKAGDRVTISVGGARHTYEIAGTASFVGDDALGLASLAVWDLETAQAVLDRTGQFDAISLVAKKGTTRAELVRVVKPLLPKGLQVKDSVQTALDEQASLDSGMTAVRVFLLGFGLIALLVGAFVIFNTLSITVAQRTREFATLRTLGASRKQVMRSVIVEGAVIGAVAAAIGILAGLGLAKGLLALIEGLGVELPEATTVVAARTIVVSLIVGTVTTVLASVLPARRANRVPPIAAVREGAVLTVGVRSPRAGLVVLGASLATIVLGLLAAGALAGLLIGVGLLSLFAGIALLAPRLVTPLARIVGWPARRAGGVAGELAGANAVRNPGRTAATAAALTIGLTLVSIVAMLGAGVRASTERAVSDQVAADYIVDGKDDLPFTAAAGDKLAAVPGVRAASHVRSDKAIVNGAEQTISGIDSATIARFYRFDWSAGSLARLGDDGMIVTEAYASKRHIRVGSRVPLVTPAGGKRTLVVRGIYDAPDAEQLLGTVSMSQAAFDAAFANPKNSFTFLDADAGADAAIHAAARGFGDATLHTGAAYPKDATKDMAIFLAMLYALLGFSVVVSLFGMVNTMVLSVFERTREIGMLRTIGMTRRQARRMIRHESVITALIGAALGLGLGVFVAAVIMVAAGVTVVIPWVALAAFTLVAIAAGILAAIQPARRASRLDVLAALQYE